MLPWKEIVRGLLEVQRLRSCILPSVVESCLQVQHHASMLQPTFQEPNQRMFSSSPDFEDPATRSSWAATRPRPKPGSKFIDRYYVPEEVKLQPPPARTKRPPHISVVPTGWSHQHGRVAKQLTVVSPEPEPFSGDELDQSKIQHESFQAADQAPPGARRPRHPYGSNFAEPERYKWATVEPSYQREQPQGWHPYVQPQQQQQQQKELPPESPSDQRLPVHTYFVGGPIALERFLSDNGLKDPNVLLYKECCIVPLKDVELDTVIVGQEEEDREARYLVVCRFGGVVFFGSPASQHAAWLRRVEKHLVLEKGQTGPLLLEERLHDETTVAVRGALASWCKIEPDVFIVQQLDIGNMRIISQVLGQSVALDHYNRKVDEAIETLTPFLQDIAKYGESKNINEPKLMQLIAVNSLLYSSMINKLGLLDTSDTAWKQDKYFEVWNSLRKDYEIERRFEALRSKFGPMIENARFMLDIRSDYKTERSERIIIYLIAAEILIAITDHTWFMWW